MAALKVACYQTTQVQTERLRESSWKRCKTVVVVEKNLPAFFGFSPREFEGKVLLFSLLEKTLTFYGRFREEATFLKFYTLFYIDIFTVPISKFRC